MTVTDGQVPVDGSVGNPSGPHSPWVEFEKPAFFAEAAEGSGDSYNTEALMEGFSAVLDMVLERPDVYDVPVAARKVRKEYALVGEDGNTGWFRRAPDGRLKSLGVQVQGEADSLPEAYQIGFPLSSGTYKPAGQAPYRRIQLEQWEVGPENQRLNFYRHPRRDSLTMDDTPSGQVFKKVISGLDGILTNPAEK